ncbi:MAG: AMP-binding protein [Acidimicrobiia bacterium]|nr:AMP-binding protein [Acidimicrobiia bacterium]
MGLDWEPRAVAPELASAYRRDGFWTDESLGALLAGRLAARRGQSFKFRSDVHPWTGTFGDVLDGSRRVAAGLARAGIGAGDVVAFQLPNWVEAALLFYGASLLGAVVVPIVHFYGPKEVRYVLDRSGARLLVTADSFRGIDYLSMLEGLVDDLGALEHVYVVGDARSRWRPFADLIDGDDRVDEATAVDPASAALVAWTSGTTSNPKGVVHSQRTFAAEARQLSAARSGPPNLMGAPVGHGIGLLGGLIVPVLDGSPTQMIDTWEPGVVLAAMLEDKVSAATGATFFLTSLLDHPDFAPEHADLMPVASMGGAPVPRAVAERIVDLGMSMIRMYGSTEHPSTTGSQASVDPPEKGLYTDGRPLAGVDIRLVDEDGNDAAESGAPGEIWSRGPDLFEGYTDPALTSAAISDDGWYLTGDIGVLDADGYLTITDRKKDIIIRGGENVSAAEVEELLLRMPGVAEVAVVAAPDQRLGEHACAFVRVLPGVDPAPDLDGVRTHLGKAGLARQKWPEELREVADFPRTASGKIQKFALRAQLRGES